MSGLLPPYFDPSQMPAWMDAQRKQQIADQLMGAFQQSNQQPQGWDSMRVVPKRGALQNLAPLVTALMAGKAQNAANQATVNYMTPQPQPTGPGAGVISPDAPPEQQAQAQAVTNTPTGGGLLPQNSILPPGISPQQAQFWSRMPGGMEALTKAAIERTAPLEIQRQLRAANVDPNSPQGQAIIMRTVQKGTYIPPIEQRPGAIERDPVTNAVIGQNPTLPQGAVNFYDAQGNLTGSGMSPGAKEAIATSEGAATAGKISNQYTTLPTAGGGSTVVGGPHTGLANTPKVGSPSAPKSSVPNSAPNAPPSTAPNSPWADMPKLQMPTGIGAPDAFTAQKLKDSATKHAELVTKLGSEADLADQKMNYNNEALKALPNAETGPLSRFFTENRAKMIEWGVSPKLIPGSGTVTPTFELNKNLLNSALQGAKQIYGARMTGNEVMLQKNEASPSVATSQAAIRSLISQDNARNAYFKQRAQDYGQYQAQGGDPNRFESWYANKFPLQRFAQKFATPPAAIAQLKAHPEQAPFFKQKFGWLPDGG